MQTAKAIAAFSALAERIDALATFGPDPRRPRPMAQDEWSPDC
jgi:hypothetical protein